MKRTIVLLALFAAGTASAQDRGFYIGAGAGSTELELETFTITLPSIPPQDVTQTLSVTDSGFRFFGGYRFGRNFGLQLDYTDLGSFGENDPTNTIRTSVDAESIDLSAVLFIPLGSSGAFDLFGRLGYSFWDASLNVTDLSPNPVDPSFGVSPSESGEDLMWSIGGQWNALSSKRLQIRAEWTGYEIDDTETVNYAGVSIGYIF